jgi:hypothetical protein
MKPVAPVTRIVSPSLLLAVEANSVERALCVTSESYA